MVVERSGACTYSMKVLQGLGLYLTLGVALLFAASVLLSCTLQLPPVFLARSYWTDSEDVAGVLDSARQSAQSDLQVLPQNGPIERKKRYYDWKEQSVEWWKFGLEDLDDELNRQGRLALHEDLSNGTLWYDENLEKYFLSKLEARQFPKDCKSTHWIAPHTHDSGLLSCTHITIPVLLMGILKGENYTVVPISRPAGRPESLPTFDGCGERKDMHVGCFFNITSCHVEDDPSRFQVVLNQRDPKAATDWDQLCLDNTTQPGGITLLKSFMYRYEAQSFRDAWRRPKLRLWNELRKHGEGGVYGNRDVTVQRILDSEIDFALHGMMSSWMMRQTTDRVKELAEKIMSKYSDITGRPLWMPPVLALHVRQTDKKVEDPYYQKYKKYRSVEEYVKKMQSMESQYNFRWESLFIISDSGSALQTVSQLVNNVRGLPDSVNGDEGKRFIMYDWTDDNSLMENSGGHALVPAELKRSAQEHFLATLYIISKIADYGIVQYSSNVGRFLAELIGGRHRLATPNSSGPNAFSVDIFWIHD